MKGLFKRGDVWFLRFTHQRAQIKVSLKTKDEAEAITAARRILARPEESLGLAKGGSYRATLDAFLDSKRGRVTPRTLANYDYQLTQTLKCLGREMIMSITVADVRRFWESRRKDVSAASAREAWNYLNWFLGWAVKEGKLPANPCASVKVPALKKPIRHRFLSAAETDLILGHPCAPWLHFAIIAALHAGLRKGEVIQARPGWFDLDAGLLHLKGFPAFHHGGIAHPAWEPKDRDPRTIPLTREFRSFLSDRNLLFQGDVEPGLGIGEIGGLIPH